ncbi:MAG: aminotransferase class I/II-fold pyridoxal phosphate-dependent enzyme [Trueperaceae bacterium]|nr:aminotransferase class I/II-fold pyridoxal phosphate-dependent enzyme [Trueperaceae bacterium]
MTMATVPRGPWDVEHYQGLGLYFYLPEVSEVVPGTARVRVEGRGEMLMFGSYSYLGLIRHPAIDRAAQEAIAKYGTGTNGVRLLAGTLPLHRELEESIAAFKGTEAAIAFASGYMANISTISALLDRHDTVICDKLDHASIVDGCLLSGAKMVRFRHNDLGHLEERLAQANPERQRMVIVDGVYSMDGDIADLPGIRALCDRYGARLMVDEAHSLGVLGATGTGIEEHFGMGPEAVDIKMGTFSKSIPSVGGFVAGSAEMITALKHKARGFIYSAAIPPASAAASIAALQVIRDEPERVRALQEKFAYFRDRLAAAGFELLASRAAIAPIVCGADELATRLMMHCVENGIFVQAILPPVVPVGSSRLRATVTATHTIEEIDHGVEVLTEGARKLGII